jgi:hypothetical protein
MSQAIEFAEIKEILRSTNCFVVWRGIYYLMFRRNFPKNILVIKTKSLRRLKEVAVNQTNTCIK